MWSSSNAWSRYQLHDNFERTSLYIAIAALRFDIIELLLNLGGYINVQDRSKYTPLYNACTSNHLLCSWPLKCGADPNIKNDFHETPILLAVKGINNGVPCCKQIVKLMLNYVRNVEIRDLNHENAIKVATRPDNQDVFSWCK